MPKRTGQIPKSSPALPPSRDSVEDPKADEVYLAQLYDAQPTNVKNYHELMWRDVQKLPKVAQEKIKAATHDEMEAHRKRGTFEYVHRPTNRRVILNRWVLDEKPDGCIKARLVIKSFSQIEGIDFDQVFSPIVRFESLRLILGLCTLKNMHILGLNVCNAYLYAELNEEIYMEQPQGFKIPGKEHLVIRLRHALYGLKQAGLKWWKTMTKSMEKLGFKRLHSDEGIYIYTDAKTGLICIAIVYVDNALFCSVDHKLGEQLKNAFAEKWKCRDLGDVKEFLCMRITRQAYVVMIDQVAYLEKMLDRVGLTNARPVATPLPSRYYPLPNEDPVDKVLWHRF
ncbi:unnamed protein product [Peniophora sp. CBMAI 1063]|nr:unnamed protein product [Peniophora sp. CBMAI 1063]